MKKKSSLQSFAETRFYFLKFSHYPWRMEGNGTVFCLQNSHHRNSVFKNVIVTSHSRNTVSFFRLFHSRCCQKKVRRKKNFAGLWFVLNYQTNTEVAVNKQQQLRCSNSAIVIFPLDRCFTYCCCFTIIASFLQLSVYRSLDEM